MIRGESDGCCERNGQNQLVLVAGLVAAIHLLMFSYLSDVRTTGTGRV